MNNHFSFVRTLCRVIILLGFSFINIRANAQNENIISNDLFIQLKDKDSVMFNAIFNNCDINALENILANNFAFYQDKGQDVPDITQDRNAFLDAIKKHFCAPDKKNTSPKMKREIEDGSLRVYPVNETEVLQTGTQNFYILNDGANPQLVEVSKFTRTWNKLDSDWKLTKEFDAIVSNYHPALHEALYDTISRMDSLLFDAFNHQNLEKLKTYFTTDLEFYHDKGGLTNYEQSMKNFKENFDKNLMIKRTLVEGSLKVYPCPHYGAMEIGAHTFCHKENGKDDCGTFDFEMVWKEENGQWKISRVLSYGH